MKRMTGVVTILMFFLLASCTNPITNEWKPIRQPNTSWESEDGSVSFYVDENHQIRGTIEKDETIVDIYVTFGLEMSSAMYIFPLDKETTGDRYEYWDCSFSSKEKFVVIVKESTFFTPGQKIMFQKTGGQKTNQSGDGSMIDNG